MSTEQSAWEFVTNLGDVNIADYGGFIVYRDPAGVYPAHVELYEPHYGSKPRGGIMYRFCLDPPRFKTFMPGNYNSDTLKDPTQRGIRTQRGISWCWYREWYARPDKLQSAASTCGETAFGLLRRLASHDIVTRASAYRTLIANWGPSEFDHYPVELTESEAQERYAEPSRLTRLLHQRCTS